MGWSTVSQIANSKEYSSYGKMENAGQHVVKKVFEFRGFPFTVFITYTLEEPVSIEEYIFHITLNKFRY